MAVGIPTSSSHGPSMDSALNEFNNLVVEAWRRCNTDRLAMATSVGDDVILNLWDRLANIEDRLLFIRRLPDFHDKYAEYRGLSYRFNCAIASNGGDVNANTDKIINLPVNHPFVVDQRVDFIIIEGSLPGPLLESTNYFIYNPDTAAGTLQLVTTEGGVTPINLTGNPGRAVMLLNIKPDLSSLFTAIDAALDEIEVFLLQRAVSYNRTNLEVDYNTRSTVETATLQTKLQDIEDLIDTTP